MFERVRQHPELGDEQPQGDGEDAPSQVELEIRADRRDHRSDILGGKQWLIKREFTAAARAMHGVLMSNWKDPVGPASRPAHTDHAGGAP